MLIYFAKYFVFDSCIPVLKENNPKRHTTKLYLCIILTETVEFMTESQLISRCKKREEDAQRIVYERFSGKMMGVCMCYVKERAEAEDLLHDAFIQAFDKIKQFKGKGSFEGWLRRVVVNTILMHLRAKKKETRNISFDEVEEQIAEDTEEAYTESAINTVKQAEFTQQDILTVVSALPEGFKVVFNLFAIEGMKHKEIAKMLAISEGTSKSQLFHARKQIQKQLYILAKEREKEQKSKKRKAIVAILTGMGLGFEHIDLLAQEAIKDLSVPVATGSWTAMQSLLASHTSAAATGISAGTIISGKTIATLVVAGSVSVGGIIIVTNNHNSEQANPQQEILAPTPQKPDPQSTFFMNALPMDSGSQNVDHNILPEIDENAIQIPDNETLNPQTVVYDTVHVPVNKVIRIKKTKIVRDTILERDTVYLKREPVQGI